MSRYSQGDVVGHQLIAQATVPAVAAGTATIVYPIFVSDRYVKIKSVSFVPQAAVTGDNTNRKNLNLHNRGTDGTGTTELANIDLATEPPENHEAILREYDTRFSTSDLALFETDCRREATRLLRDFRTNLEAAAAIARQLRLRNLGGIIIIDFIDMTEEEHRRQVLQTLTDRLAGDHAKSHVMNVSPLGLVEMTRKRNRESLEHVLCQACPSCEGRGFVKTAETVCHEIFREILRQHRQFDFQELLVLARPQVIERLLDEDSAGIAELEEVTGKPIRLQSEALYSPEQFDVVLM